MRFDPTRRVLYVHGSETSSTFDALAKVVLGDGAELIRDEDTFRVLYGLGHLVPTNVGLVDVVNQFRRFSMRRRRRLEHSTRHRPGTSKTTSQPTASTTANQSASAPPNPVASDATPAERQVTRPPRSQAARHEHSGRRHTRRLRHPQDRHEPAAIPPPRRRVALLRLRRPELTAPTGMGREASLHFRGRPHRGRLQPLRPVPLHTHHPVLGPLHSRRRRCRSLGFAQSTATPRRLHATRLGQVRGLAHDVPAHLPLAGDRVISDRGPPEVGTSPFDRQKLISLRGQTWTPQGVPAAGQPTQSNSP